jgi:hypothetical protein
MHCVCGSQKETVLGRALKYPACRVRLERTKQQHLRQIAVRGHHHNDITMTFTAFVASKSACKSLNNCLVCARSTCVERLHT